MGEKMNKQIKRADTFDIQNARTYTPLTRKKNFLKKWKKQQLRITEKETERERKKKYVRKYFIIYIFWMM